MIAPLANRRSSVGDVFWKKAVRISKEISNIVVAFSDNFCCFGGDDDFALGIFV